MSQESSIKPEKLVRMDLLWMCNSTALTTNTTWCLGVPFFNFCLMIPGLYTEMADTDTSLYRKTLHIVLRTASALSQCPLNKLYGVPPIHIAFWEHAAQAWLLYESELSHINDVTLSGHKIRKCLPLNYTAYTNSSPTQEIFGVIAFVLGCEISHTLLGTWERVDFSKKKIAAK